LMRQDPDVILLGEIRDHETAATAVQAALTGHLLISTLHTNDAVGSIVRLKDLGLDDFKIGGSLLGAIAQRLLRKICPSCKEPHTPNEKMLKELPLLKGKELPSGAEFYMGRGCRKCMGTGYTGRLPIYEIMVVTSPLEKAIEEGYPGSQLREIAAAEGMVELATAGLEQALQGNTSIEEVYFKLSS
ncbi:MAG: Flp pilus assembly complex ATPase component TadA, partial [Planctomycetes bacterium]|nr:Flp pilus assembly complex ATPase component TadA [Planctomycetota bacterium]